MVWSRLTYRGQLERRFGRPFPMGCSGPWGDDTPGRWLTYEDARAMVAAALDRVRRKSQNELSFWCDWHARL
jgi:hypothetical protein